MTTLVPVVIDGLVLFLMSSLHNNQFIPPLPGRQFRVLHVTKIQLKADCLKYVAEGHSRQWRERLD